MKYSTKNIRPGLIIVLSALLSLIVLLCVVQEIRVQTSKRIYQNTYTLAYKAYNATSYDSAIKYLSTLTDKQQTADSYLLLGNCYEALGENNKAISTYNLGRNGVLDASNTLLNAESILRSKLMLQAYQNGDNAGAEEQASWILSYYPDNEDAKAVLAALHPLSIDTPADASDASTSDNEVVPTPYPSTDTSDSSTFDNAVVSNPHRYQFFCDETTYNLTWDEAQQACENRGGHLATITSQDEFDQIVAAGDSFWNSYDKKALFESTEDYEATLDAIQKGTFIRENEELRKIAYQVFWVGASRGLSDNQYTWTADSSPSPLSSSSFLWKENEPSFYDKNTNANEYVTDFFYWFNDDRWVLNDVPNDISKYYPSRLGYICEWDE